MKKLRSIVFLLFLLVISFVIIHFSLKKFLENPIPIKITDLETSQLNDIQKYIPETDQTLIIFDIDNVLGHQEDELGSDEWFEASIEKYKEKGLTRLQAVQAVLPAFYFIQFNKRLIPSEQAIPDLLKQLYHKFKAQLMALTSRGLPLTHRTIEQLNNLGINFTFYNSFGSEQIFFLKFPCLFKNGILFAGDNKKGSALKAFLKRVSYHPSQIIFIDDKQRNIESIKRIAQTLKINFVGIRYNRFDEKKRNFDKQKTDEQYQKLLAEHNLSFMAL